MHTDTIFYQIFLTFHTLLFEILGEPTENARDYKFTSLTLPGLKTRGFLIE